MAPDGHFRYPTIYFLAISYQYTNLFFPQNGRRLPFWMTENHFRSHFSQFHIQYATFFFTKWPPATILDDRKSRSIVFLAISENFYTKWPPAAILYDGNYFRLHFLPFQINTQTVFFFHKMAADSHFGWPKITFDCIFCHFRSIHNLYLFNMATGGQFGWPKISFDRISAHFRSILNFVFFHKMAAGGHFGWPKINFDRISRHFRSISNFFFSVFFQNGRQRMTKFC